MIKSRKAHSGHSQAMDGSVGASGDSQATLIDWEQLQPWQQDNEFIRTCYRRPSWSFMLSLRTISQVHNETVNIWTHGLGSQYWLLALLILHFSPVYSHSNTADVLMVSIMFASVVVCFLLSTSFHVCLNHSPSVWRFTSQLDHLGIVLVILGSTVPSAYFGFYCDEAKQRRYGLLATAFAAASAYATFQPAFRTPTGRKVRFLLYSALGLSAFIPAIDGVRTNGWAAQNQMMSLQYFIGLGLLNFTGAAIYAARIPERWYPARFDMLGASHQIMHVLVMCGAVSHSMGLLKALSYWDIRRQTGQACPG